MKRIVICSGKVNRLGYRIIPQGVQLSAYINNPIILPLHNASKLSIGKMTDIRIEENGPYKGQLTGLPVFDMDDAEGAEMARKYDNGFINSCSMGHDPSEVSKDPALMLPGQKLATVTKTELLEISMTNVPGDRDAIGMSLTLDNETGGDLSMLQLSNKIINENKTEMDLIKKQLGLPDTATETEIVNAVNSLQLAAKQAVEDKVESLMLLGKTKGVITEDNLPNYKKLAFADFDSTSTLINNVEAKVATQEVKPTQTLSIADQLKQAGGGKTPANEQMSYEKLSKENPTELLRIKNEEPEKYAKLTSEYSKGLVSFK